MRVDASYTITASQWGIRKHICLQLVAFFRLGKSLLGAEGASWLAWISRAQQKFLAFASKCQLCFDQLLCLSVASCISVSCKQTDSFLNCVSFGFRNDIKCCWLAIFVRTTTMHDLRIGLRNKAQPPPVGSSGAPGAEDPRNLG